MFFIYGFDAKRYFTVTARIFPSEFLEDGRDTEQRVPLGVPINSVLYLIVKRRNKYDLKENYRILYIEKKRYI